MQEVINSLTNIPTEVWAFLGAALGVSVLLQKLKTWLSMQSDKVVTFWLALLSAVPAVIDFINSNSTQLAMIVPHTATIAGAATFIYRYVTKPATNLLNDAKLERERREAVEVKPVATEPAKVENIFE